MKLGILLGDDHGEKVIPRVVALLDVMQLFDGAVQSMIGRK